MATKFYYFGFGSNMLARRIQIANPTAARIGLGRLENYRLDFHTSSTTWMGAPATIVPTNGAHVYGAIWEIDCCNMQDLDRQEGVELGIYVPVTLPILCINTEQTIDCRVYHLTRQPEGDLRDLPKNAIPKDRQPSKSYLKTVVKGALETGVPEEYVAWLRTVKHNCKLVDVMEKKLDLHAVELCAIPKECRNGS